MASISCRSKPLYHVRSVSLPSCPHSLNPNVDEHLNSLKSSESTSLSLSSIGDKLNILEEMYDSLDDVLQLPNTQQSFKKNKKWVEEILDGYIILLDLCAKVKDISSQMKEDVQELLYVLRRRSYTNEIGSYLISRKKTKIEIQKSQKDLKNIIIKQKTKENDAIESMFTNIEEASVEVLRSLMSYIAGSKSQSTLSDLISRKYMGRNLSSKSEFSNKNEFEKVDEELEIEFNKKADIVEKSLMFQSLQRQLTDIDRNIQNVEEGLNCLFRRLIQTRVSLLNTLNH